LSLNRIYLSALQWAKAINHFLAIRNSPKVQGLIALKSITTRDAQQAR